VDDHHGHHIIIIIIIILIFIFIFILIKDFSQKATTLVSSLSLAWASALFQMMNPPLCIVTLLSLPGRLPPWLPAQACLLAHLPRGRPDLVGGRICKNLQSDSTFAWQHREIRNELPHLEATLVGVIYKVSGAPHSFTASA
jgi:hypothetical protein